MAIKEDVMREALGIKFAQHLELVRRLLATTPSRLMEHTANDLYWADGGDGGDGGDGDGGDGGGRNRLGEQLHGAARVAR